MGEREREGGRGEGGERERREVKGGRERKVERVNNDAMSL